MTKIFRIRFLLLASMLASPYGQALDLNAGDYDPAPAGTTISDLYFQDGLYDSLYSGSSKVPGRNRLHTEVGIVTLEHYMDVGGKLVMPLVILPFGQASETVAGNSLGTSKGLSNLILSVPVWLYNNAQTHSYLTVAPYLYLPTGSYNDQRAINLSDNRYRGTLQAIYSTHLSPKVAWDIAADATVYGDNTDAVGGGTLSQKAGYELQANVRYLISGWTDLRAGLAYTDEGATKQLGVTTNAFIESKFWLGTGLWVSHSTQLILTYGRDIAVQNGFKDANQFNMKLVQVL